MIEAKIRLELHQFLLQAEMSDSGLILLSGENGSGKTTFLKCLAGLQMPALGSIIINGRDVTTLEVQERKVVYATQNSYFGHLDADRHISWPVRSNPDPGYIDELKDAFGIDFDGKLRDLSMGQRMRVTLATAFASKPDVILLDEVISNISNPEVVLSEIKALSHRKSVDVIFVAHAVGEKVSEHHYSLRSGSMERIF